MPALPILINISGCFPEGLGSTDCGWQELKLKAGMTVLIVIKQVVVWPGLIL